MLKKVIPFIFFAVLTVGKLMAQDNQQHVFNIYFKTNSDEVIPGNMNTIRQQLLYIGTQNIREIKIKGHADSDANDSFNINLSNRRALNCHKYLLSQGVPESMMEIEALGESAPISDLKSLNRRAEITIIYEYTHSNTDITGKKIFIKGLVTNFNTKKTLNCRYVIEDQKLNVFQSTKADGKFIFPAKQGRRISLTFHKENYLSSTVQIDENTYKNLKGDTLYLEIKLKPIEVVEKIVFDHIFFYSDSDSLKPESKPELDRLTGILRADKNLFIEIQGHMNCPISKPLNIYQKRYNNELSHKRARAVYRYLVKNGIPPGQLTFKGMSNTAMIYKEPKNEEEADKNKRVEVWKLRVIE